MTSIGIWYVPIENKEEAQKLAQSLVQEELAACVNIINSVNSVYKWEGQIQNSEELILIIKAPLKLSQQLQKRIHELHSYEVPCIIQLPLDSISDGYEKWLNLSCRET